MKLFSSRKSASRRNSVRNSRIPRFTVGREVGSCETDDVTDTMPAEDTETNESDLAEDMESDEEALEPSKSMPVKRPSTRGTRYSLRGSIKPPHRYL